MSLGQWGPAAGSSGSTCSLSRSAEPTVTLGLPSFQPAPPSNLSSSGTVTPSTSPWSEVGMRISSYFSLAAGLVLAALSSPLFAEADSDWSTDHLDDAWAERALANPELDEGWCQPCHNESDHRVGHCEVREFSYPLVRKPIAIDGGDNSGMTVMGWNRDHVRILYRVTTRARTEERTHALAAEVQLALTKGWLRPDGPSVTREGESWMVEVKAWVPRSSDLALSTENGPLGVRDVH